MTDYRLSPNMSGNYNSGRLPERVVAERCPRCRPGGGRVQHSHLGLDPVELLTAFPAGLTTQEVAQLLTRGNDAPDRVGAEVAMLRLVADGNATRTPLGDDALWKPA